MSNFETTFIISLVLTIVILTIYQVNKDRVEKKKYKADVDYRDFLFATEIKEEYLIGKSREQKIVLLLAREEALKGVISDRKFDLVRHHGINT